MRCGRKVIGREVRSEARGLVLLLGQGRAQGGQRWLCSGAQRLVSPSGYRWLTLTNEEAVRVRGVR